VVFVAAFEDFLSVVSDVLLFQPLFHLSSAFDAVLVNEEVPEVAGFEAAATTFSPDESFCLMVGAHTVVIDRFGSIERGVRHEALLGIVDDTTISCREIVIVFLREEACAQEPDCTATNDGG